jgi:CheY-like chemotaxis protein
MRDHDGIVVTKEIKRLYPDRNMPVVLFSSLGFSHFSNKEEKDLFAAILVKPAKHSLIKKTLMDVLGEKKVPHMMANNVANTSDGVTNSVRILVAEDNDTNQKLIRKTLEKLGYGCELVNNGAEAVEAAKRKYYDLILMDVMMPEMDGYEATKQIISGTDTTFKPVIIAMTANALADDKNKAMKAEMEITFSKRAVNMNKHEYLHINLSYLYEIADDDIDFVKEMISDYIEKVPEQYTELKKVFSEQDFEQTRFIAHKIKSSFQFMGARQLIELAYSIEQRSQTSDTETITQNLNVMEPLVEQVLDELRHQLSVL